MRGDFQELVRGKKPEYNEGQSGQKALPFLCIWRHMFMKKELKYFEIDGAVGGSQEWFKNVVMYIGGCHCLRQLYLSGPGIWHGRTLSL